MARERGRPKEYDADIAIAAAGQVFWAKGFNATSLDELCNAMGMNRPSVYRAFGDKEAIYRKALDQFRQGMEVAFAATMQVEDDITHALTQFYQQALVVYTSGEEPKGCMVMSTAVVAATEHPEIQADLLGLIRDLDNKIAQRFSLAQNEGQLPASIDVGDRAALAQSLLHSLSLRARAGERPARLRSMIKHGVQAVLG